MRGWKSLTAALAVAVAGSACGGDDGPPPLRQLSNSYSYTISSDDSPPHARQDIHFSIQIFDRKTRQPIENGEGRLFASNGKGANTWDGFVFGPEVGTYHAKLNYVLAGQWAVAIQFRRDTLRPLERIDWMQDVFDEKPEQPGKDSKTP
jgi:hypothetical protein